MVPAQELDVDTEMQRGLLSAHVLPPDVDCVEPHDLQRLSQPDAPFPLPPYVPEQACLQRRYQLDSMRQGRYH